MMIPVYAALLLVCGTIADVAKGGDINKSSVDEQLLVDVIATEKSENILGGVTLMDVTTEASKGTTTATKVVTEPVVSTKASKGEVTTKAAKPVSTKATKGEGSTKAAKKDIITEPAKKDESTKAAKKDESTKAAKKDIITKPAEKDESTKAAKKDIITKPAEKDESTKPARKDIITKPAKKDESTKPAKKDIITKPAKEVTTEPSTTTGLRPALQKPMPKEILYNLRGKEVKSDMRGSDMRGKVEEAKFKEDVDPDVAAKMKKWANRGEQPETANSKDVSDLNDDFAGKKAGRKPGPAPDSKNDSEEKAVVEEVVDLNADFFGKKAGRKPADSKDDSGRKLQATDEPKGGDEENDDPFDLKRGAKQGDVDTVKTIQWKTKFNTLNPLEEDEAAP